MEVAAVDQRHMHGRVLQPPGGMQAAEAAADDYDMGKPVHLGHVLDPKSCIEAKVTFTNGLRKTKFRPSWTSRSLLAQKKVSGTFGRSKLQHFLRLESSRHLFLGKRSFSRTTRPGSASKRVSGKTRASLRKPCSTCGIVIDSNANGFVASPIALLGPWPSFRCACDTAAFSKPHRARCHARRLAFFVGLVAETD